jgi:hypothetical protein
MAARRASETTRSSATFLSRQLRKLRTPRQQQLLCCVEAKEPDKRIPTPSRVTDRPYASLRPASGRSERPGRVLWRGSRAGGCVAGPQRTPALLAQVGQAFHPWAVSTFSAISICCDRVAWLAVPA